MTCKEEILELLRSTGREGIEDVIGDLESWGFFTAPASAGHHLNVEGGLARHSLNTCKAALAVFEAMKTVEPGLEHEVKRDSIILCSLLHDVCKCDIYKRTVKKRKNALGIWEDAEGYKITYKGFPMGHGEKSLTLLLCSGLPLNDDEMLAIRWHMGAWDLAFQSYEAKSNINEAGNRYPLLSLIQSADNMATHILEL
jgi:hypothetical protein